MAPHWLPDEKSDFERPRDTLVAFQCRVAFLTTKGRPDLRIDMHRHVFIRKKMYDLIEHLVLATECNVMLNIECIINTQLSTTQANYIVHQNVHLSSLRTRGGKNYLGLSCAQYQRLLHLISSLSSE